MLRNAAARWSETARVLDRCTQCLQSQNRTTFPLPRDTPARLRHLALGVALSLRIQAYIASISKALMHDLPRIVPKRLAVLPQLLHKILRRALLLLWHELPVLRMQLAHVKLAEIGE